MDFSLTPNTQKLLKMLYPCSCLLRIASYQNKITFWVWIVYIAQWVVEYIMLDLWLHDWFRSPHLFLPIFKYNASLAIWSLLRAFVFNGLEMFDTFIKGIFVVMPWIVSPCSFWMGFDRTVVNVILFWRIIHFGDLGIKGW